jgi:CMP-N-acetylneuraminic acid synthetase
MIHSQTVTALVPIKDHSERVPGKNFKDFIGKPLYHHIVENLDVTYAVDEILIDTDSPRVILEAKDLSPKVRVIERPEHLRGDFVSMNKVIAHDLEQSRADIYLQTHATNPLLKPQTIANALKAFVESEEHDSLFTVNQYQSRFYHADGTPLNHDPENLIRTQDLDPLYEENSGLYVFTRESFFGLGRRIGAKPLLYPIDRIEATDIDDAFTFRLAELLALYASQGET